MFGRTLHTTRQLYKSSTGLEKSALAALRKKTGYTFANCKKALELHNNDVNQVREEKETDILEEYNKQTFSMFFRQKNGCTNRRNLWAGQRPPSLRIV